MLENQRALVLVHLAYADESAGGARRRFAVSTLIREN
jgi:hypothetical protein